MLKNTLLEIRSVRWKHAYHLTDTMLITDLLVALLAVAVHAAPTRDVHDKGSTEPEHIRYEIFKAMTLDERLHHYEGRKIYRPDKTLNCLVSTFNETVWSR